MAKKSVSQQAPHNSFGKILSKLILILALCVLLAAFFVLGAFLGTKNSSPVITSELLGQQLRTVQELVSVEYYYTNMGKFENQVDFYGWKVPFTSKRFIISYNGVIKAGIDFSRIEVTVDEIARKVTVTLPEGEILSHEIKEDSIQIFDETDNLFNHITLDDYIGFTQDQKEDMAEEAVANGLLTAASEKARATVESFLTLLPGMEDYTLTVN